jgi:hypothetical protein
MDEVVQGSAIDTGHFGDGGFGHMQRQKFFDRQAIVGIAPSVWKKTSQRPKSLHDLWSKSYPFPPRHSWSVTLDRAIADSHPRRTGYRCIPPTVSQHAAEQSDRIVRPRTTTTLISSGHATVIGGSVPLLSWNPSSSTPSGDH